MAVVEVSSHSNSDVGTRLPQRGKPSYQIWLHEDVLVFTQGKSNLQQRLVLVLQHLMAHGRTGVVKGCRGNNRGWRRSPMGGPHGMHYYLWWTTAGSAQSRDQEFLADNGIAVRQVRHHDQHSHLPFGRESDYYEPTPSDLRDEIETFFDLPLTTNQRKFVIDANSVRTLRGQPGSGKTTALWHAITAWPNQRVLYLTWSSELTERAREHFAVFALDSTYVDVRPYSTFLSALSQLTHTYSSPAESFAVFKDTVIHYDLGPWAGREYALYTEMRAQFLGRAVPDLHPCQLCNGVNRLHDTAYDDLRSGGIGSLAVKMLLRFVKMLPADQLAILFPDLFLATAAIQRLRADDIPDRLATLDRIVVDEVQDLTALEIAVVLELCTAIRHRHGYVPWLLLTGDEGQTVQPSGFQWKILNTLLTRYLNVAPKRFSLAHNLRCPSQIVDVIDNASLRYKYLKKEHRPHKQMSPMLIRDETVAARLFYIAVFAPDDASKLLERLLEFENLVVLSLETDAPAWMPEAARRGVLTPEMVKGLEYQSVCLLNLGLSLGKLDATLQANTTVLEQHASRTAIDRLRVALSRATETLVFVDVDVSASERQLSRALLGPARILDPDDLIMHFEDADTSTDEKILAWTRDARQLIDTNPAFAWRRAGQAWRWLASLRHETVDATVRCEAQNVVLDIASRLLISGVPAGIDRDEITATAHEVLDVSASRQHVASFERLTAWSRNREEAPFALLSAVLALDADPDHWLIKALPYASQAFLQLLEKYACESRAAHHFTDANAVAEWLHLIGFAGDASSKARDLQRQAEKASLQAKKEKQKKTAQSHYEKGLIYLKRNKKKEAIQKFRKATQLDPEHAEAFYQIGYIYSNTMALPREYYEISIEHLNKAIMLKPNDVDALIQRGVAYRRSGKFDEAISDFNQAIKLDPKNAKAYNRRGVVYAHRHQYNEALKDYSQAIKLNPEFVDAYVNRGNIYSQMGKFKEAENDYQTAHMPKGAIYPLGWGKIPGNRK